MINFNPQNETYAMIGTWQPWTDEDTQKFKEYYSKSNQIVIFIKNVKVDQENPYAGGQVARLIESALSREGYVFKHDYDIISVPNIIGFA